MHCRARFGRGGRLVLDRVHPITREPYTTRDPTLTAYRHAAAPPPGGHVAPAPQLMDVDAAR